MLSSCRKIMDYLSPAVTHRALKVNYWNTFSSEVCIIYSAVIKHILEERAIITNVHSDILQPLTQKIIAPMCAQVCTAVLKTSLQSAFSKYKQKMKTEESEQLNE